MKSLIEEWRGYKSTIEECKALNAQIELFPARTSTKDKLKEVRLKMFMNYECFININNSINVNVLETILFKWFEKHAQIPSRPLVKEWMKAQNFKNPVVRYVVEENIEVNAKLLFVKLGIPLPKEGEENLIAKLAYEIVKNSEGFIQIPNNEKNFDVFLNGSTQYLERSVQAQESFESPIEEIMYNALKSVAKKHGMKISREHPFHDEGMLTLKYSVDILFIDSGTQIPMLAVETDGLTFHSGYDQMTADRMRDRWLLIRGIPTMRFTSREIFNNLDNCVIQVDEALKTLSSRRRR